MKLKGQAVLITGASRGLGVKIAEACLSEGADLYLCARGKGALEETRRALAKRAAPGQKVVGETADMGAARDAGAVVSRAVKALGRLDALVNNAGVYGPMGPIEDVDWKEWMDCLKINLFGPVLACRAALRIFKKQGRGKIVNLSGGGATQPMPRISAYAASKSALVRLTETMAEENKGGAITVNAIAPGALNTTFLDQVLAAGPKKVGADYYERSMRQKEEGGASLETAARLCVFLLSSEGDGVTGRLISAVWDGWPELARHAAELEKTDIYTLRRIVPKDRAKDWK
jgi:NAD(P)-dependent dehydrogenase (short-subunit alcohol dehydrogenase family)